MKKNILNTLLLVVLLSACGKDDVILYMPGTETPIEVPSRIEITITSPESDTDSDADVPTDDLNVYLIPASGDTSGDGDDTDVPSATFTPDTLVHVEADTYTCLVTNAPTDDTTLTGTVLTLEDSDQDGFYDSAPDVWAGSALLDLEAHQEQAEEIAVSSYTRPIRVKVSLQAIEPEDITSVDYTLTGVATSVDLSQPYLALTSTPGGTLAGNIASLTASDGQLVGTDDTQVLGINLSTPPVLTINVTLVAGTLRTLELDVAEVLDELQASTTAQPLTLHAIMSIGMGEPTGSIEPWEPGWDEDLKGE